VYRYGAEFYHFLDSFALKSAQRIVPILTAALPIRSVVDFGCGQCAWLSVWQQTGAAVTGVDGPYVDRRHLAIDPDDFQAADLAQPIDLHQQFDLVQSLEVAEHLPASRAEGFIDALVAHGSCILFSAAVPGQGGENHINERPLGYWRMLFRARGYVAIDYLRPLVCGDANIMPWYRYNILLYVRETELTAMPEAIRSCLVSDGDDLRDYWPLGHRLRHRLVRQLPIGAVDRFSRVNAWRQARRVGKQARHDQATSDATADRTEPGAC
jgi:SAM-dependent methyltransferase